MYDHVKTNGKMQTFETGAVRDTSEGKGRYDLLPAYALKRVAQHFENGARKYADENWRKGMPLRKYLDSAIRHAFNFLEGQRDEDHAAAAAWNILALIETEEMIRRGILPASLNNLPNWTEKNPPALSEGACTFLGEPHVTQVPLDGHPTLDNPYTGRWVTRGGFKESIVYVEIDGPTATSWNLNGTIRRITPLDAAGDQIHVWIDKGYWVPYTGPEVVTPLEQFDASCEEDSDRCGCNPGFIPALNVESIRCLEYHHK